MHSCRHVPHGCAGSYQLHPSLYGSSDARGSHFPRFAPQVRLLLYSVVPLSPNPSAWGILPIELLQGLTLGVGWSAITVSSKRLAPPGLASTMQGITSALFGGLGAGMGSLAGGGLLQARAGWPTTWAVSAAIVAVLWAASGVVVHVPGMVRLACAAGASSTAGKLHNLLPRVRGGGHHVAPGGAASSRPALFAARVVDAKYTRLAAHGDAHGDAGHAASSSGAVHAAHAVGTSPGGAEGGGEGRGGEERVLLSTGSSAGHLSSSGARWRGQHSRFGPPEAGTAEAKACEEQSMGALKGGVAEVGKDGVKPVASSTSGAALHEDVVAGGHRHVHGGMEDM